MKLKFKPSSSAGKPQNQFQPEVSPPSQSETSGYGKWMIILSLILFMGMMTIFFQGKIDQQKNPNQRVSSSTNDQGQIIVQLKRNRSGHYVALGSINNSKVTFLLDTGATDVAIPLHMQQQLNLHKGRKIRISTANGLATGYQTMIDHLSLGKIQLSNIRAILTPNLEGILLGMSALKQLEFTQQGNQLILKQ